MHRSRRTVISALAEPGAVPLVSRATALGAESKSADSRVDATLKKLYAQAAEIHRQGQGS